jgi:hypothetical protein
MDKLSLRKLKMDLLFEVIHAEERSDDLYDIIDQGKIIFLVKHESIDGGSTDTSIGLYIQMIYKIERLKGLILVCDDLQASGYKLQRLVAHEDNYYQDKFRNQIYEARSVMKKLRPYILAYTKDWSPERKLKELSHPLLAKYFKGWYYRKLELNS